MAGFLSHLSIRGKLAFKDRGSLFWVFLYPFLLVTMMTLAFRGLGADMPSIKTAAEVGHPYQSVLEEVEILDLWIMEPQEAREALMDRQVTGIFKADRTLQIMDNSIQANILKEVGTELARAEAAYRQGYQPDFSREFLLKGDQKIDPILSILAMTLSMFAFYSYFSGISMVDHLQANLSPLAARFATTPLNRLSFIMAGSLINTLLSAFNMTALLIYLKLVWQIDFLTAPSQTLLLLAVTGWLGVAIGLFVGSSNRLSSKAKIPLGITVMLVLGAFAGMMGPDPRLFLDRYLPWLNRLNPLSHVGKLLYRLNALSISEGYWTGILLLAGAALLLSGASLLFLRKRQYKEL